MRASTIATSLFFSIVAVSNAAESRAAIRKHTDIPGQRLETALQTLAQIRDLQVICRTEVVGDLQTAGASGELTEDEALAQLLSGTGLTYRYLHDSAITIVPLAIAPPPASNETRKPERTSGSSMPLWDRFRLAQVDPAKTASDDSVATAEKASEGKPASAIEEIIVTAQKRAERLEDVPISISVLSGEDLDRSTARGVTEALASVPGVATMANRQGSGTNITIRGVAAGGPVFSGSSPVAYYADSVPFSLVKTALAPDASAYDLERVEVLRGPQGTLYGASALNGVVRVLTKDADLGKFELKARASSSDTVDGGENYRGDIAVNAPLVEGKLAARAVLGYQDSSGWVDTPVKEDANDEELKNLRLKINAQPTDKFSVGMSAWLSRADYGAPSTSNADRQSFGTTDEAISIDTDTFGLKLGYDFEPFTVTSMSSYLKYDSTSALDLAASTNGVTPINPAAAPSILATEFTADVFSQEIILNSTLEGSWRWSVGGMYRDAQDDLTQAVVPAVVADYRNTSESYALFGEVTRLFKGGKLELTAGLRYFEDDVTVAEKTSSLPFLTSDSATFDKVTPRLVMTWHPNQDLTAYVSYSEGFRSGFPQDPNVVRAAPSLAPAAEDSLRNYEIGAKGDLWGDALSFDAAVYFIDWQDAQQQIRVLIAPPNLFQSAIVNSESVSGMGVDFAITIRPASGLTFALNASWNDLGFDDVVISRGAALFSKGDRPNLSPEYTLGASLDYSFPLGASGYAGQFSAGANYTSELDRRTISGGGVVATALGDPITLARAGFSIQAPNHWSVTLFVDNLTDENGSVLGSPDPANPAGSFPALDVRPRPRTIGLQFDYSY